MISQTASLPRTLLGKNRIQKAISEADDVVIITDYDETLATRDPDRAELSPASSYLRGLLSKVDTLVGGNFAILTGKPMFYLGESLKHGLAPGERPVRLNVATEFGYMLYGKGHETPVSIVKPDLPVVSKALGTLGILNKHLGHYLRSRGWDIRLEVGTTFKCALLYDLRTGQTTDDLAAEINNFLEEHGISLADSHIKQFPAVSWDHDAQGGYIDFLPFQNGRTFDKHRPATILLHTMLASSHRSLPKILGSAGLQHALSEFRSQFADRRVVLMYLGNSGQDVPAMEATHKVGRQLLSSGAKDVLTVTVGANSVAEHPCVNYPVPGDIPTSIGQVHDFLQSAVIPALAERMKNPRISACPAGPYSLEVRSRRLRSRAER